MLQTPFRVINLKRTEIWPSFKSCHEHPIEHFGMVHHVSCCGVVARASYTHLQNIRGCSPQRPCVLHLSSNIFRVYSREHRKMRTLNPATFVTSPVLLRRRSGGLCFFVTSLQFTRARFAEGARSRASSQFR